MLACFRKIAGTMTAAALLIAGGGSAQEKAQSQKPGEATRKRRDVEKRLRAAEKSKPMSVADAANAMNAAHHFDQVAISPDGTKVAWVEALTSKDGASAGNSAIYVKDLRSDAPRRHITADDTGVQHAEHGLAWSPDSSRLAFLSDANKK